MTSITRRQFEAAKSLLRMSIDDVAAQSHVSRSAILRWLREDTDGLKPLAEQRVVSFFENKRVIFLDEYDTAGIRPQSDFELLTGVTGFETFMDDVYETVKYGGSMSLYNTEPEYWIKYLGKDWYDMHNKRMSEITEPLEIRNAIKEGNYNYILSNCEYRWIPKDKWKNTTFYAYGSKLALLKFADTEEDIKIRLVTGKDAVEAYMELFETAWEHNTIPAEGLK